MMMMTMVVVVMMMVMMMCETPIVLSIDALGVLSRFRLKRFTIFLPRVPFRPVVPCRVRLCSLLPLGGAVRHLLLRFLLLPKVVCRQADVDWSLRIWHSPDDTKLHSYDPEALA